MVRVKFHCLYSNDVPMIKPNSSSLSLDWFWRLWYPLRISTIQDSFSLIEDVLIRSDQTGTSEEPETSASYDGDKADLFVVSIKELSSENSSVDLKLSEEIPERFVPLPDLFVSWGAEVPRMNPRYEEVRLEVETWFKESVWERGDPTHE